MVDMTADDFERTWPPNPRWTSSVGDWKLVGEKDGNPVFARAFSAGGEKPQVDSADSAPETARETAPVSLPETSWVYLRRGQQIWVKCAVCGTSGLVSEPWRAVCEHIGVKVVE